MTATLRTAVKKALIVLAVIVAAAFVLLFILPGLVVGIGALIDGAKVWWMIHNTGRTVPGAPRNTGIYDRGWRGK
jgi:hypothetical protein